MKVILVGYRGSGKTSVGRPLAERLGWPFVDVDDQVCKWFGGVSIAEIWRTYGEPAFREREVEVTREQCLRDEVVIGLGGGTLMQPGSLAAVESAKPALRVYLRCEPEELAKRISTDTQTDQTRPNLTEHGGGIKEVQTMLAEREPVYRAVADLEVDVTSTPVDELVDQLFAAVEKAG